MADADERESMRSLMYTLLVGLCLIATHSGAQPDVIKVTPADRQWTPFQVFGRGAQMTLVRGHPLKPGLFVILVRVPANTQLPVHTHPVEHVLTVLSGTYFSGLGDKMDLHNVRVMPSGSVFNVPAQMPHYAEARSEEVLLQVIGIGPTATQFLNPAEDPRPKPAVK